MLSGLLEILVHVRRISFKQGLLDRGLLLGRLHRNLVVTYLLEVGVLNVLSLLYRLSVGTAIMTGVGIAQTRLDALTSLASS